MPLLSRRCSACQARYDVLDRRGMLSNLDRDDDKPVCPKCDSAEFESVFGVAHGIDLGDEGGHGKIYPYFDRGLGRRVSSAKHRRELCKQLGVTPADGGWDHEKWVAEEDRKEREDDKALKDYHRELEESPHFRDYRELRDKGYYREQSGRGSGK